MTSGRSSELEMTVSEQVVRTEPVKQIAKRIVSECLRVKTDEQVAIYSYPHTLDYASSVALEVEKAGGVSNMILETDDFFWGYLTEVPEAQYLRRQRAFLSLLEETDAQVALGGPKDPAGFGRVSGERLSKMFEGEREIGDRIRELKIRNLNLPIGLITQERAKTYGIDYNHWKSSFNNALNVDYQKISSLGSTIARKLEKARNVHLTSTNGTDLKFNLSKERPVHIHDGVIDEKDRAQGNLEEGLPAGTVEVAPDETSVEGKIVFDQPTAMRGKMLQGLRWEFQKGHLVSFNATGNLDVFKGLYDEAKGDKDKLADLAIGLNPAAELIGFFNDRIVLGTASVGIGGNKSMGGVNDSQFGHEQTIRKPTIELDGQRLIVDGRIQA